MEQDNNTKNEGVMAEQLAKPQPPLNQDQMSNKEMVRKTIKKYQNKVNEMLKIIQRQKKQNDSLKQQLKNLNESLNNTIAKVMQKPTKHQEHPRDDVLRKQLENEIKKNVNLQKQVVQLRAKVKINEVTKITQMHNELKQKDKIIQQLNQSIKTYAKVQKQQNNLDIYKREQQLTHKINLMNQEILHLKKKLNQQKKHQQMQQKSLKRQHQQIITLQTKYKTTQGSHTMQPVHGLHGMVSTATNNIRESLSPPKGVNILNNEQYKKLKENFQSLQNTKKANQKQFKQETDNLKLKIKILEKQLDEAKQSINRKDKESNILMSRMKQIQRKGNKTLQPLQIKKSQDINISGIFDQRKQFKGLPLIPGNYRKFDDTQSLSLQKNYKIKKILFTWFEEHILSLDTTYELQQSNVKQISSFKIPHSYQNVKTGQITLSEYEYIKDIEVFSSKLIEFIRIKTSREQILEVGSQRNCTKCKKYTFEIRSNQKPIAFLGAIDNKKNLSNEGKQMLIAFGLEIKKKQVTAGKTKFNVNFGKTDSLRKNASKSLFDSGRLNDKNIEEHS